MTAEKNQAIPTPDKSSLQLDSLLTQAVKSLVKTPPVFIAADATVGQAAEKMQDARIGSILVATDPPGIVTDRDLRGRVLATGLGPGTPVIQVASAPLKTIGADMLAFSALRAMIDDNIHHLPVVEEGAIIGVISATDLLLHQTKNPIYLRGIIERLDEPAALADYARQIARLVEDFFRGGLGALQISQIVASLNDALVRRLVYLAEHALGAPPAPYAWIVFGSEGRMEQTLLTDQDNALVFVESGEDCRTYFEQLSERVIDGLIQAGFPPCPGGFMATRWHKPLAEWRQLFTAWIGLPEPPALLDAAIFFDFRAVAGGLSLEPLEKIIAATKIENRFLAHMAYGALAFRPPLGFFNRVRSANGKLDIKEGGIAPIVGLARVAALAAGSRARSTLERLRIAGTSGAVIDRDSAQALAETMPVLLRLRLRAQLAALQHQRALDNDIDLNELSSVDRRQLKEAFILVKRVQQNLRAAWRLDALA